MKYRKLPGHRRGLFRGSSLWMAPDHVLLVQSARVREEYKRFYFRDIQAIVVADAPRFHVSTRALAFAALWLIAALAVRPVRYSSPAAEPIVYAIAVVLIGAWIFVSAARSCRCRIYTAVSRDELPSLYRSWTARKFLAAVAPEIRAVQGEMPPDAAERLEALPIGPLAERPLAATSGTSEPAVLAAGQGALIPEFFVLTLFADAFINAITLESVTSAAQWAVYGFSFLKICTATLVLLKSYRGQVGRGMQRLALACLLVMGLFFYARPVVAGMQRSGNPAAFRQDTLGLLPFTPLIHWADIVSSGVLGLIGAALVLRGDRKSESA
jgi:hypothetical protein